ncbi:MAG: DUF3857 domain-containing protein [Crocinitomicaceae bacterium]|nr:DUF3857 domain-containing protein [Crocinitomicaceae bacterium]
MNQILKNIRMKYFWTLLFAFFCLTSHAQKYPFFEHYKWEKSPVMSDIHEHDALYYYTKYTMAIEYEYDEYYGRYFKYKTEHYRIKLNSDIAIEEFNKIYISMEDVVNLKSVKARVIKPDKVVDFKPAVEEFYSDEESEQYYYFPVEGIELGDEIEILYTLKMESAVDGDQFYFQGEYPVYNFDFYFIGPNDAYFDFLAHNNFPEPDLVDTILHRHQWTSHLDTIPAFKAEYFSEYNNVTMKLDVTLRGFGSEADRSYSPYDNFEVDLNSVYNKVWKGKDLKSIQGLGERLGLNPRQRVEDNVRLVENFIKTNIALNNDIPMSTPMADVIETERAGSIGCILLYMALFNEYDIRFEYGFISDRYDTHFSNEIESMYFLQSYIFYFPDIEMYLAPLDFSTRLGYLDKDWIPNNALLFTMKQYPTPVTTGKVKPVPAVSGKDNADSTIIRINVLDDYATFEIEVEVHLTGYEAGEFQSYYHLYNAAKKELKSEALLNVLNDNSTYKVTYIANVNPEDAYVKPLIVKGIVTELHIPLIDYAGEKMIFKLGSLFGEYAALKEIEKKKTDFTFGSALYSVEVIEINFPTGSIITLPANVVESDDLCPHDGIVISSHMKQEGTKVTYIYGSYFESNHYPIETKDIMMDIFRFWNGLQKMNIVLQKG